MCRNVKAALRQPTITSYILVSRAWSHGAFAKSSCNQYASNIMATTCSWSLSDILGRCASQDGGQFGHVIFLRQAFPCAQIPQHCFKSSTE
eukprot:scaffold73951_cov23-Tisochrysis_lutea.AAC.1